MTKQPVTVLITGASGFIGSFLLPHFLEQGFKVVAYARHTAQRLQHPRLLWVSDLETVSDQIDYVVNLAGESIGGKRWSPARKQVLIDSRVQTTRHVFRWLAKQAIPPKKIISASAVGYYGIDETRQWQQVCDEQAPAQDIFMSQLCREWEEEALSYRQFDIKIMRLGVVFARGGGILPQMLLPIRFNLVGRIGSGRQPVAWIHIRDVLGIVDFLLAYNGSETVFNAVAPAHTVQADFVAAACKIKKRYPLLRAPAGLFALLLGEQSQLILNGQFVAPAALLKAGYGFRFGSLDKALYDIENKK